MRSSDLTFRKHPAGAGPESDAGRGAGPDLYDPERDRGKSIQCGGDGYRGAL